MVDRISSEQFREAVGVEDWRVLANEASARFRTESFAIGLRLVNEIGRLAEAANHHPDIDLRYSGVTVRLTTHETGGLSERDVSLARAISSVARALDLGAD